MSTNNIINFKKPFPLFFGYYALQTAAVTGDGSAFPVAFDSELFDESGSFDTTTGIFTAPITAKYYITCNIRLSALDVSQNSSLLEVGLAGNYLTSGICNIGAMKTFGGNAVSLSVCGLLNLTVGDAVQPIVTVSGGLKSVKIDSGGAVTPSSWICGYLIAL